MTVLTVLMKKQIRKEMSQKIELERQKSLMEIEYSVLNDARLELRPGRLKQKFGITEYAYKSGTVAPEKAKLFAEAVKEREGIEKKMHAMETEYDEILSDLKTYEVREIAKRYEISAAAVYSCYSGRIGWNNGPVWGTASKKSGRGNDAVWTCPPVMT